MEWIIDLVKRFYNGNLFSDVLKTDIILGKTIEDRKKA
jgi:hypothetical protein